MFQSSPAGEDRCCILGIAGLIMHWVFQSSPAGEDRCCLFGGDKPDVGMRCFNPHRPVKTGAAGPVPLVLP